MAKNKDSGTNKLRNLQQVQALQEQEIAELKAQNEHLQIALAQREAEQLAQNAALADLLAQLEAAEHLTTIAKR